MSGHDVRVVEQEGTIILQDKQEVETCHVIFTSTSRTGRVDSVTIHMLL